MEPIEMLSLTRSIIGAAMFVFTIAIKRQIIARFKKLKSVKKWKVALWLTVFFLCGYAVNIISILTGLTDLGMIFGALVYALGGVFVTIVVHVSNLTYKVIFDAAAKDVDTKLDTSKN